MQQAVVQRDSCLKGTCCKEHGPEKGAESVDASNGCIHDEVEVDI